MQRLVRKQTSVTKTEYNSSCLAMLLVCVYLFVKELTERKHPVCVDGATQCKVKGLSKRSQIVKNGREIRKLDTWKEKEKIISICK